MEFKVFTDKSFKETKTIWQHEAAEGLAFLPDVTQLLEWAMAHKAAKDSEVAYGLFDAGSGVASAICSVVIAHGKTKRIWVKFIRLSLRPSIEDGIFNNKMDSVNKAVECYLASIKGVLRLKNEHNADTIKIYGRTQEQMRFLMTVQPALFKSKIANLETTIEGRWLVLRYKP